jgi:hypothetical protein
MLVRVRPRLSYANVMATVAVFIALGGASYAAFKLPKNGVGTKQLKKNAVIGVKVKDDSLTGSDINEATLGTVASANNAQNATSAQTLDGRSADQLIDASKPTCPAGMELAVGVCFTSATRGPVTQTAAFGECTSSGWRLPSEGEMAAFDKTHYTEPPAYAWVEPRYTTEAVWIGLSITSANGSPVFLSAGLATGEQLLYRCVTEPSG